MKSISRFLKSITLFLIAACAVNSALAQGSLPVCSGTGAGMVYFASKDSIWRFDPNSPTPVWTGIFMPTPGTGGPARSLAVSRILPVSSGTPTYYTTMVTTGLSRVVHYWDPSVGIWIATPHVLNQEHIAGGGGYLFGVDPASGYVFRYDGLGSATILAPTIPIVGAITTGSYDIAADCSGNFYILNSTGTGGTLRKFSSAGNLLNTYTLAGTFATGGEGLAVNGDNVFYDGSDGKLYTGVISGTTVTFSASSSTPFAALPPTDFGSCGLAGFDGNVGAIDTFKACNGAVNVSLTATGPGPYNWTVISGPATITGSGQTVSVSASATSIITHNDANCAGVNDIVDTNVILVASGSITIDPHATIYNCGQPVTDSLKAHVTNRSPGLSYAYKWVSTVPSTVFFAGTDVDTTGIFQILRTTKFYFTASAIGCDFTDSITVKVVDSTPFADFQFVRKYGCDQDTVVFFNTSYGGVDSFAWYFWGDTNRLNTYPYPVFSYTDATNPTWIYNNPDKGFRPVRLLAKNQFCTDTVNKLIDLEHTLFAYYGVDTTTACADHEFRFSDSSRSRYPPPLPAGYRPATISYYFGDGTSVTGNANPRHRYSRAGTYTAMQVLVDFRGCTDTFRRTIIVDSLPFVRLITQDTLLCQGQALTINAEYLAVGNTGATLDMGDGTIFPNTSSATYAYLNPGTYNVVFSAFYRYCPTAIRSYNLTVRPFPGVNIGPDTVLCPNGQPLVLSDRANMGSTTASYTWNTGEKTQAIYARNIGTYWARVNIGGCTATDTLVIRKDCFIDIPNSFTPNGDGANDYFLPRQYLSRSVNEFKMTIYNRWGQKVFETATTNGRGWDGKFNGQDQPQGVFIYQIEVGFDNGVKEHYTGNLTLLR